MKGASLVAAPFLLASCLALPESLHAPKRATKLGSSSSTTEIGDLSPFQCQSAFTYGSGLVGECPEPIGWEDYCNGCSNRAAMGYEDMASIGCPGDIFWCGRYGNECEEHEVCLGNGECVSRCAGPDGTGWDGCDPEDDCVMGACLWEGAYPENITFVPEVVPWSSHVIGYQGVCARENGQFCGEVGAGWDCSSEECCGSVYGDLTKSCPIDITPMCELPYIAQWKPGNRNAAKPNFCSACTPPPGETELSPDRCAPVAGPLCDEANWYIFGARPSYCDTCDGYHEIPEDEKDECHSAVEDFSSSGVCDNKVCGGGVCYFTGLHYSTFDGAIEFCASRNAVLATVHSDEQNDAAYSSLMASGHQIGFLGFSDREVEGEYQWVDRSEVDFQSWQIGEPNGQMLENCAAYFSWVGSGWIDIHCEPAATVPICMTPDDSGPPDCVDCSQPDMRRVLRRGRRLNFMGEPVDPPCCE